MFYRQLPATSPVSGRSLPRAMLGALDRRGDERAQLQERLRTRYNAHGSILTAKGTHALQLALAGVARSAGDKLPVLLPGYTCYEVATAAVGAGVRVSLYDVDPNTLEPDWDSVRAAAPHGAAAIVVAPLYGMPLDWNAARGVARELGAPLIEDAAQAFGTVWDSQPVGAIGDVSILSFGRGKGWTGGAGGAVLWRGELGTQLMRGGDVVPNPGTQREAKTVAALGAQWLFARPHLYGIPASIPFLALGETIYHEPTVPSGIPRTAAMMLLASEAGAHAEVLHRRTSAKAYHAAFSQDARDALDHAGCLRFPLRRQGGWESLKTTRAPEFGAAPPYPTTLRDLPQLQTALRGTKPRIPGSEELVRELVTLPTHSRVGVSELMKLIEIVQRENVRLVTGSDSTMTTCCKDATYRGNRASVR